MGFECMALSLRMSTVMVGVMSLLQQVGNVNLDALQDDGCALLGKQDEWKWELLDDCLAVSTV